MWHCKNHDNRNVINETRNDVLIKKKEKKWQWLYDVISIRVTRLGLILQTCCQQYKILAYSKIKRIKRMFLVLLFSVDGTSNISEGEIIPRASVSLTCVWRIALFPQSSKVPEESQCQLLNEGNGCSTAWGAGEKNGSMRAAVTAAAILQDLKTFITSLLWCVS